MIGIRPIPGARTAVTFAAGMLGMPWRRFLAADAVAAVIWGGNEVLLGYAGGTTFEHSLWKPLLAGLALAALLSAASRVVYRRHKRAAVRLSRDPRARSRRIPANEADGWAAVGPPAPMVARPT